jgi:type IV pilus assembly protein PilW
MNNKLFTVKYHQQRGVTLIELMVGITISLLLALVASSAYLYSKQGYNAVSETSQMEENGRFALNTLARYLQSSGFVMIDPKSPRIQRPSEKKINGCDYGYTNIYPAPPDFTCRTSAPSGELQSATVRTIFQTDTPALSSGKFQGADCVSNAAISYTDALTTHTSYLVVSHFFISSSVVQTPNGGTTTMGQLSCMADRTPQGGAAAYQVQPMIPGIQQLAAWYLVPPTGATNNAGQVKLTAAEIETGNLWDKVVSVELCVLAKSIGSAGQDVNATYRDCYGNALTVTGSESYRTFRTVVNLRNRVAS